MSTRNLRSKQVNTADLQPLEKLLDDAPTISFYDNEKVTVSDAITYLTPKIAKLHTVKHYSPEQIVSFFMKNNAPFDLSVKEVENIIKAYKNKCEEMRAKRKSKKESTETVETKNEDDNISEPIIEETSISDL